MSGMEDQQRRDSAARLVTAAVIEAHHTAELTAAFLAKHGIRPGQPSQERVEPSAMSEAVRQFLFNLGAALKVASWEEAGLTSEIPADALPSASEAMASLVPQDGPAHHGTGHAASKGLPACVFRTWAEHFAHEARSILGADVVLKRETAVEEAVLDLLAEFLVRHSHLGQIALSTC